MNSFELMVRLGIVLMPMFAVLFLLQLEKWITHKADYTNVGGRNV